MKQIKILFPATVVLVIVLVILVLASSCTKDLNTSPIDPNSLSANKIFSNDSSYSQFLAQCYGGLGLTGLNANPGYGDPDFTAGDEGTTSFGRALFTLEELSTDEVFNYWGDGSLNELHYQNWSDANSYLELMYERLYFNITVCNQFIADVTPRLGGLSGTLKSNVTQYIAEARFLRALNYFYAMDLWGNIPFVTEKDPIGAFLPPQITQANLFAYIESELKAIGPALLPPSTNYNVYGRANKAAAWMLLAKLYLNAPVYLGSGTNKYASCIAYCDSIINTGVYSLHTTSLGTYPPYVELFLGDNHRCTEEIIFPIRSSATESQTYGGATYLVNAECAQGTMPFDSTINGLDGTTGYGWGGNTTTYAFMQNFTDMSGATDTRAMFTYKGAGAATVNLSSGQVYGNNLPLTVSKWRNKNSNGAMSSNTGFMNNDIPIFRYSEVLLTYAEATIRNTGSPDQTSLNYVNQVLTRAYNGSNTGNITLGGLTLNFLMAERGREFYWEMQRRTDLIRFGQFSGGTYVWDWKGGVAAGRSVDTHYNLYPLPAADLGVNSNLKQNPGY